MIGSAGRRSQQGGPPLSPRSTKLAVALLAVLALPLGPAAARAAGPPVVVTTGKEKGAYYWAGSRLQTEMQIAFGRRVDVMTSEGSLDNLERLASPDHPAGVGLAQADALADYLAAHPDFADDLMVLGDVGRECAFLVTRREGGIARLGDLASESGAEISVEHPTSGSALTWRNLGRLRPELASVRTLHGDTLEALVQLKAGGAWSKLRAALFVQRPRRISPPLRVVLETPDAFRLVPVKPSDLPEVGTLPDGSATYTFETVTAGAAERRIAQRIETLCTRALLLASRSKLDADQRKELAQVMLEHGAEVAGADE